MGEVHEFFKEDKAAVHATDSQYRIKLSFINGTEKYECTVVCPFKPLKLGIEKIERVGEL